jgi:hypothetical protein
MADISQQIAQGFDPTVPFTRTAQVAQGQQRIGQEQERLGLLKEQETRVAKQQRFNNLLKVGESVNAIDPSGQSAKSFLTNNLSALIDAAGVKDAGIEIDPQRVIDNGDKFLKASRSLFETSLNIKDDTEDSGANKKFIDELSKFEQDWGTGKSSPIIKQAKEAQALLPTKKTESRTRFDAKVELATKALEAEKGVGNFTQQDVFEKVEGLTTETVGEALEKTAGKSEITLQQKEFEDFQEQVGESDRQIRKNIKSNAVIDIGLQQLQKGIISGTFAKAELAFKKALSKAGLVNPETEEKITTTEAYAGLMGIRVGQVISLFGAGTGLSDADREFAEKIAAGDITLDITSLNRLQKLNKQVLIEEAIIHNDLIDEFNLVRDDRGFKPSIRKKVDTNKFLPNGNGNKIDVDNAKLFKAASRGDRVEAERLAKEKGWTF